LRDHDQELDGEAEEEEEVEFQERDVDLERVSGGCGGKLVGERDWRTW
jgi:hypothetical protein